MAIGEVFLGALLQVLLEKVGSGSLAQIKKRVKGVKIDEETINNLEEGLRSVAAQLHDAEQQQHRFQESEVYKIWVEDLQDLAFDLEDLLDRLATDAYVQQLQQTDDHEDGGGSKGCNTPCFQSAKTKVKKIVACGSGAMQCFEDPSSEDLPSKIKEMSSRFQEFHIQGRDILRLSDRTVIQQVTHPSIMLNSSRETTSLISERIIYGREEKKIEVIQKLLNCEEPSTENYDVISIVGKGGIGKTTLAQYVYNDPQVKRHFDVRAWMCVSDEFDLSRATMDIINSATDTNLSFSNLNQSQHKLAQVLKDKRFLIVLDDVWMIGGNDWQQLQTPFLHGARGSKAIVTTRKEETARMMSRAQTHNISHLDKLSDDCCWKLFNSHANLSDDDVDEMKSDIITKCGGLPLAAKALGILFIKTVEKSQRQSLLKSGIWTEESDVLPVLRLSYFHLPSHLKQLFAYCSIFPKDYEFEEKEVILFWMAQGMLLENTEDSMEVKGHHYFLELVSSSLFERNPIYGERYVMHDLVHDLSQWAAGDLCLCITDTKALQRYCKRTRHLNLDNNVANEVDQHMGVHQLRTFMSRRKKYIDSVSLQDFISRFESIRTLSLASETITELPKCIGDLKLLRFLDLRFEKITLLPKSIEKLYNLHVLFLTGCYNLRESLDFGLLKKLRHVRFPKSLWEVMPLGIISKLTNLQSLGAMYLGDDHGRGSMIRELKSLNHLHGKLTVIGLEYVTKVEDAREMHLDKKSGLENLCFEWSSGWEHEDRVLEQLKPNSCIKECELNGYMGLTLPSWLGDPAFKNMVEIWLVNCEKCEELPLLGQLPSLKKLLVERMNSWERFQDSKFPFLEELLIYDCQSFQGTLPPLLPCLKILTINNCSQAKVSLPSSPKFEELTVCSCEALLPSTDMLVIHCSKRMCLGNIKSGFTGLQVDGPCRQELNIGDCESLVSIERIPVSAEKVYVRSCRKLEWVEWEGASASSASNSNGVSIHISHCDSVVRVGNIPSVVAKLVIIRCKSIEDVMFGGTWNSVASSEATDGDNNGPPQLELAQLVELRIWSCPKLRSPTKGVLMPPLQQLQLLGIMQGIQEWGLYRLTHLKCLIIWKDIRPSGDSIECIKGTDVKDDGDDDDTILHLPSTTLCELEIVYFRNLKTIKFSTFPNLTTLEIVCCQKFALFRDEYGCGQLQAAPIQKLRICHVLVEKPIQEGGLDLLTHLQSLKLQSIRWGGDAVERILGKDGTVDDTRSTTPSPSCSPLYLPSFSLRELIISGHMNNTGSDQSRSFSDLKSINCSTFPNLTHLRIYRCPNLESLGPNNDLPSKLKDVLIEGSPLIEQQCTSDPNGLICFERGGNRYRISNERQDHLN